MLSFNVWIRIGNGQTAWVTVNADNMYVAERLATLQYGEGSVLNVTQITI